MTPAVLQSRPIKSALLGLMLLGAAAPWSLVFLPGTERIYHAVDALAISAALVGLALALQQRRDTESLQSRTKELRGLINQVAGQATRIADSTSTRFVAVFPDNVDAICKLISSTRKSLLVLCDVAGYAHFSAPAAFFHYKQALEQLAFKDTATVSLIVYDDQAARHALHEQLGAMKKHDWPAFVAKHGKGPYAKLNPERMKKALAGPEEFAAMINENELNTRSSLLSSRVKVGRTSKSMPVYLWISDDETAIISYIARSADALEYSFQTSDPKLIEALRQLIKDFFREDGVKWESYEA